MDYIVLKISLIIILIGMLMFFGSMVVTSFSKFDQDEDITLVSLITIMWGAVMGFASFVIHIFSVGSY